MRFYVRQLLRGGYCASNASIQYTARDVIQLETLVTYYHPSAVFYHI
jgi:hypothetical protein